MGCELAGGCASTTPDFESHENLPFLLLPLLLLLFFLAILDSILGIFSLDFIPVSGETLEELAKTAAILEGPVGVSELAACQLGESNYCPDGLTEADVTCQLEYMICKVNEE